MAQVIDNGDAGFSTAGGWLYANNQGNETDVHYAARGSGSEKATWTFNQLTPGVYRVAATWSPYYNRATNSPFTIKDGNNSLETVFVNQELAPRDFVENGTGWKQLGASYFVTTGSLVVELSNNANEWVIADAIRIERVNDPEIQVLLGNTEVADNVASIQFGAVARNAAATRTFTVRNRGNLPLTLGTIDLSSGFRLISGFGSQTLAASDGAAGGPDETTFVVAMNTDTLGTKRGTVSFTNNDRDESPFNFELAGTVQISASNARILDNGDQGFSTNGTWLYANNQGYQTDVHYSSNTLGSAQATWQFTDLTPGSYRVSATWSPYSNRATNAPFTISSGSTQLGAAAINQRSAPNDLTESSIVWEDLGSPVTIQGTTLTVSLGNNANGWVIADAIRIERLSALQFSGDATSEDATSVSGTAIQPLLSEAMRRWSAVDSQAAAILGSVRVEIVKLPASLLGLASRESRQIWISEDAAGQGWFVDSTPDDDGEFAPGETTGEVSNRVDLLTVLAHEMGHILGREDRHDHLTDVMGESLTTGQRRMPGHDEFFATWAYS